MAKDTQQKSKRDAFRDRFSLRNPDLDMNNEDAYYDAAGKMMDEYEGYEKDAGRIRDSIGRSPAMAEMMIAARDTDGFDPLIWMIEQGGLDLDALRDDPEYSKKLGEAREKHLAIMAKQADIDNQVAENMPKTVEMVKRKQQELGLTDEQANEIVAGIYKQMDDLIVGIISPEMFEAQVKAMNYDQAVNDAHDEGVAQGLQTRVTDKLRTFDNNKERIGGRQAPMKEEKPKREMNNNPFLA